MQKRPPFLTSKYVRIYIPCILFFLLITYAYKQLLTTSRELQIHPDERIFVNRGQFADLYLSGEFNNPVWQSYPSYDVPKFAELMYGLTFRFTQHTTASDYLKSTGLFYNEETNGEFLLEQINTLCCSIRDYPLDLRKTVEPILVARKTAILFALGSLFLAFLLGWLIASPFLGLIFAALFYGNPLFQSTMTTAMGDSPLMFFFLLHIILTVLLVRPEKNSGRWKLLFILASIVSGLATSTKLNGGLTLFYFSITFLFWFPKHPMRLRSLLMWLGLGFLVSFGVFILLNPYLWSPPLVPKTLFLVHHRIQFLRVLQEVPKLQHLALLEVHQRLSIATQKLLFPGGVFTHFLNISRSIPFDIFFVFLSLLSFVDFAVRKTKNQFESQKHQKTSIILWSLTLMGSVFLLIPMDFDHYYLPAVIVLSLLESIGILFFVDAIIQFFLFTKRIIKTS